LRHGELPTPTFGTIPVVGDGKWIWTRPPEKEKGQLEPRTFETQLEIRATGRGQARNLIAGTVMPAEFPEQKFVQDWKGAKTESAGSAPCRVSVQRLSHDSQQMLMMAESLAEGQVAIARCVFRMQLTKSYLGFGRDQFPAKQDFSRKAMRQYLGTSPGLNIRSAAVAETLKKTGGADSHPWDRALTYQHWVFENIKGRPQKYTSVESAIKKGVGDCEERAGVFIALCRASGIPARLVWIPSHCWAEILLIDHDKKPHWIPVHTAAYSWFGWTGVHELVLQKGDNIRIPQNGKRVRLVYDHYRCEGKKPKIEYTAKIRPVAEDGGDAGPGARQKLANGKWKLVSHHDADRFHRKD
jgi:hypothetical protein